MSRKSKAKLKSRSGISFTPACTLEEIQSLYLAAAERCHLAVASGASPDMFMAAAMVSIELSEKLGWSEKKKHSIPVRVGVGIAAIFRNEEAIKEMGLIVDVGDPDCFEMSTIVLEAIATIPFKKWDDRHKFGQQDSFFLEYVKEVRDGKGQTVLL